MKARVAVLLSAYNGERYIAEQLNSILSGTLPPKIVLVRDDGSTDHTRDILSRYAAEGKLTLLSGENMGFKESFRALLTAAPDADYYAFSDQDDVWEKDKLSRAVELLAGKNENVPLLYHGAYIETDGALTPVKSVLPPDPPFTFYRALTENVVSGFSMVINGHMREQMLLYPWEALDYHDWLAGAVALGFGEAVLDDQVTAMHRRTNKSVSRGSLKKDVAWALSALTKDSNMKRRNLAFLSTYGALLPPDKRAFLERFTDASAGARLWRAFYPHRWRYKIADECAVRLAMLIGTL